MVSLYVVNMYLHGISGEKCNVTESDSFMNAGNVRYDIVLTNPSFGKKGWFKMIGEDGRIEMEKEEYNCDGFIATTSNKQINFLQ